MPKIVIGDRQQEVVHPVHTGVKAILRIPGPKESSELAQELRKFRKNEYLEDPKSGTVFRDKKLRPIYETVYEATILDYLNLLRPFLLGVEGDLEIENQSGKDLDWTEVVAHEAFNYTTIDPIIDLENGRPWTDEKGRVLKVEWDEEKNEPKRMPVLHRWWDDLLSRTVNPPAYAETDEGKGSPTPSTAS